MRLRALLIFALTAAAIRAALPLPMQDGEKLTYRVSWAIVPGAGEITIAAENDPAAPRLLVNSKTATRGLARVLLKFDAASETIFDLKTGQLLSIQERSEQGDKKTDHSVTFDYPSRTANYVSSIDRAKSRPLPMPPGDPTDLMMALLQTRSWDLKPGETRDALVLFDSDFYELTIHMARYEQVRTSLGTFKTVVLEPRMDKTPPKGMFKRGSSVRVWIAQDSHRLPVKFEVMFKIGTGTATLVSYQPPPAGKSEPTSHGDAGER